jgi:hypothetical protein
MAYTAKRSIYLGPSITVGGVLLAAVVVAVIHPHPRARPAGPSTMARPAILSTAADLEERHRIAAHCAEKEGPDPRLTGHGGDPIGCILQIAQVLE